MSKFAIAVAVSALMASPAWSQATAPNAATQASPGTETPAPKPEAGQDDTATATTPAAPKPAGDEATQPEGQPDSSKPAETPGKALL